MKKIIVAALFIVSCVSAHSQGYSLRFNRVIDTTLTVYITSCVDLGSSGVSGFSVTVPQNTVWKLESVGPMIYYGQEELYVDCNSSSYQNYGVVFGIVIDDGQADKGYLKRRIYNGSWANESIEGTVWLKEGTSMYANISPRSTSYRYTRYVTGSYQLYCKIHVTIIEFILIP